MKNIVLYAPPAAGKGTQCELLIQKHGYEVISIGQVLRNQRNPETEIGRIIIQTQDEGILTPDDIVAKALQEELKKYENKPIVVEGYPRNINQAILLDTIIDNYIVINLDIERDVAMKRTLGRVSCKGCNKIYNVFFDDMSPRVEGVCDICGMQLDNRSDDNESSFNVRFDVYETNAPAILDFYRKKGILYIVDSNESKDYTSKQIEDILSEGIVND